MTYPHTQRIDRSPTLLLAACTCGWREPANNRTHAWELNHQHATTVHEDGRRAAAAKRSTRRPDRRKD